MHEQPGVGLVVSAAEHNFMLSKWEGERAQLRGATLRFSGFAVAMLRRHALLLPPEVEQFEVACAELTRALETFNINPNRSHTASST